MNSSWQAAASVEVAQQRALLLRRLRAYFDASGALEVCTPVVGRATVTDVNIESLGVSLVPGGAADHFLQTSPEYSMKRLLCSGYPDIYQICKVFRSGEVGRRHQHEFTMIEWYRLHDNLDHIIADTVAMIVAALDEQRLADSVSVVDYCDAFATATGCDALQATATELADAAQADTDLRAAIGNDRNTWLDLLMSESVTPAFNPDCLTVVRHYPAEQAALARLSPSNSQVADRFEVFYQGMELANGYVELTDADEQSRRFNSDLATRERRQQFLPPVDQHLLAAMRSGLPPCSGVAAGLDRLLMLATQLDDIRDVTSFPEGKTDG